MPLTIAKLVFFNEQKSVDFNMIHAHASPNSEYRNTMENLRQSIKYKNMCIFEATYYYRILWVQQYTHDWKDALRATWKNCSHDKQLQQLNLPSVDKLPGRADSFFGISHRPNPRHVTSAVPVPSRSW